MLKEVLIFGAGGFAREIADLIRDLSSDEYKAIGYLDKDSFAKGQKLNDLEILGSSEDINKEDIQGKYFSAGFGEIDIRRKVVVEAVGLGLKEITLIHPSVIRTPYVELGNGCILCAGSILTNKIKIGRQVLINLGVTIGHDVAIGDFCTLSPGVHISGRVKIGSGCYFGTGSVVLPNLSIGDNVVIGAGAVVTKDIPSNLTVVGIPAKPLREE